MGIDENIGPVAVSLKREKVDERDFGNGKVDPGVGALFQYRIIVRTGDVSRLLRQVGFISLEL